MLTWCREICVFGLGCLWSWLQYGLDIVGCVLLALGVVQHWWLQRERGFGCSTAIAKRKGLFYQFNSLQSIWSLTFST